MLLFHLATRLGKTVCELEDMLGMGELNEWAAYIRLEKNPPKPEPFYSKDPKVMADKMREILVQKPRKK